MLTSTLPLFDRNGLYVRQISIREAAKMVNNESAQPIQSGGWRDRPDLQWEGVRLSVDRCFEWSPAAITCREMDCIVGAAGEPGEQNAARIKLALWRSIH
jgi:hypothetical protein